MLPASLYRPALRQATRQCIGLRTNALPCNGSVLLSTGRGFQNHSATPFYGLQVHGFATQTDDKKEKKPEDMSFYELLEENEALRKQVEELKTQKSGKGKFMSTITEYGMPFFFWWTGLYLGTGVAIYSAFRFGFVSSAGAVDFVMSMGGDKLVDPTKLKPEHGDLAIAVLLNEAIEPIRFPFTLATLKWAKRTFSRSEDKSTK